ncbi:LRR domain containing protein, partial [Trema orientale]
IHLRYLSLYQRYGLIKLPETMCNLFNLQTLELRESVSALPKGIGKLVNLRHLYLGRPMFLPKELGNLTLLETLDFVSITSGSSALSKEVMKLDDFSKLKHLKGRLAIHIGKVEDVEEAESAQLKNKERLVHLVLNLYGSCTLEPACKAVLLLEGLQPHPNLKHLEICSYYGIEVFPSWMISLTNLKTLVLERGRNCEFLGAFGKLPSLESLTVSVMAKVKKVGLEFLGIEADGDATWKMETCSAIISFPKLKQLEFFDLSSWEEWESESCTGSSLGKVDLSCFTIMPSLVSLKISWCYDLKPPLPAFLRKTPLQKLTINCCKYLEQRCQEGMRTDDLVKILTSITSESITEDTVGVSEMTEATTSRDKISPEQEQEITPVH